MQQWVSEKINGNITTFLEETRKGSSHTHTIKSSTGRDKQTLHLQQEVASFNHQQEIVSLPGNRPANERLWQISQWDATFLQTPSFLQWLLFLTAPFNSPFSHHAQLSSQPDIRENLLKLYQDHVFIMLFWASQAAQWYQIHLPMQETQDTWVQSLSWDDPWKEK